MTAFLVTAATMTLIYGLLALSLNLQWGQTGLINFGLVASFAIGAYATGLLTVNGWPIWLGFTAAALLSALAAWPLGRLTLTLKADYLAVVAIGFSEVLRTVLENEEWLTRGPSGLPGIPGLFAGLPPAERGVAIVAVLGAATLLVYLLLSHLGRSPFGETLRAIRDDEMAAEALGKNVVGFKTSALVLGAAIAGTAGAFYAHYLTFISPEQFTPDVTFNVWIAVIIGGSGSNPGALLGTVVLMIFMEGTRFMNDLGLKLDGSQLASIRFVLIGLALILCMILRPEGLLPPRRRA